LPEARRASAEALTNLASTPYSESGGPKEAGSGSKRSTKCNVNLKVEVQRAGAVPVLVAMLGMANEACIQAAANTLYVLAENDENHKVMAGAGVQSALLAVLAKSKAVPPQISDRTRRDCEEAMARVLM
jgi:hypothetical protein